MGGPGAKTAAGRPGLTAHPEPGCGRLGPDVLDDERLMMKRTLVSAAAVGLLLAGCATGDTGHLNPEISPDLVGPRSTQEPDLPSGDDDDTVETPAPGASGAAGNEVEQAFAAAYGEETWYDDVEAVDTDDDTVQVSTRLEEGDPAAVDVCEAVFDAAEETGLTSPTVDVRDVSGNTISQRDDDSEGCSEG